MNILAIKQNGTVIRGLTGAELEDRVREPDTVIWADLHSPPDSDDQENLMSLFGLSDIAIAHLMDTHSGPRATHFRSHVLVVVYEVGVDQTGAAVVQDELVLFVGKRFVLSLHHDQDSQVPRVASQIEKNIDRFDVAPETIVFSILDAVVDDYRATIGEMRRLVQNLESMVLQEKDPNAVQDVYDLGTTLTELRRIIYPEAAIISSLTTSSLAASRNSEVVGALADIEHDIRSAVDEIDQYQSMLPRILSTYESLKSDNLNRVVQLLAVWSIILTAVTLFPTVLGISLANGLELSPWMGYVVAALGMFSIGFIVWRLLKREGWMS